MEKRTKIDLKAVGRFFYMKSVGSTQGWFGEFSQKIYIVIIGWG